MRPSVEEQLAGTCRVLEGVVLPAVADPYARTLLAGLIGNLRMLGGALPARSCRQKGVRLIVCGLAHQPLDIAQRSGLLAALADHNLADDLASGLSLASHLKTHSP